MFFYYYYEVVVDNDTGEDYVGGVKRPNVTDIKDTTAVISWEVRCMVMLLTIVYLLCYRTITFLMTVVFHSPIEFSIVLLVDYLNQPELSLDIRISTL